MTDYTPRNPSQKQHNCEHPHSPICEQPARVYRSGRRVKFFCDTHAPKYQKAGANVFKPEVK
jgi:hypothetical protein